MVSVSYIYEVNLHYYTTYSNKYKWIFFGKRTYNNILLPLRNVLDYVMPVNINIHAAIYAMHAYHEKEHGKCGGGMICPHTPFNIQWGHVYECLHT